MGTLPRFAKIILGLNVLIFSIGSEIPQFPAWRMYESAQRVAIEVLDGAGRPVQIHDFLPKNAQVLNSRLIRPILSFICRSGRVPVPLTYRDQALGREIKIGIPTCEFHDE